MDRTERPPHRRYPQRYPQHPTLRISNRQTLTLRSFGDFPPLAPGLEGGPDELAASGDEIGALCEAVSGQLDEREQELPFRAEPKVGITFCRLAVFDAEGMDVQLIKWFPFDEVTPLILHYETKHMTTKEHIINNKVNVQTDK